VSPLMAVTYTRDSVHDLVNLNFSVVLDVFLKFRKLLQSYDNIGEKL
jgi:hypothetical protein